MGFWTELQTWVAIAFVLFFVIFGKRLWQAIAGLLDARAEAVRRELEEAARLREEAQNMLRDAEQRRATALKEAQELIAGAKVQAEQLAEAAAAEAQAAARRQQMAIARIASAEKAAVDELANHRRRVGNGSRPPSDRGRSGAGGRCPADRPRHQPASGGIADGLNGGGA